MKPVELRTPFVPDTGDIVWLSMHRPALVLSPKIYNVKSGLALVCPITNHAKGYPFEVLVPPGSGGTGVILADHLKNLDWKVRRAKRLGRCPNEVMVEVRAKLGPLLGF